jgi:uncharacterized protein YutE (UPF0331/DUF86 family)
MASLSERIEAELENIEAVLRDMPSPATIAKLSRLEIAGASALLHSFYLGVENILKQMLAAKNVPIPTGDSWHRDLIDATFRIGIISSATRDSVKEYLAFRHFFAHAYAFTLDAARLQPLIARVHSVFERFRGDIAPLL